MEKQAKCRICDEIIIYTDPACLVKHILTKHPDNNPSFYSILPDKCVHKYNSSKNEAFQKVRTRSRRRSDSCSCKPTREVKSTSSLRIVIEKIC